MIRLLYCLRRRLGTTLPEFHEHWLNHHIERYGRPILKIRRYVLYTAVDPHPRPPSDLPPYDGIATVWFDDVATLRETMDGAMPEAGADEKRFIDHDRSRAVLADDRVIVEPDAPAPAVLFECLARTPDVTPDEFSAAWLEHGKRAADAYQRGLLQGYIQSHVRTDPEGGTAQFDKLGDPAERWDGIGAAYFDSVVVARRYLQETGGLPTSEQAPFIQHERTVAMLARRHPRRDPIR